MGTAKVTYKYLVIDKGILKYRQKTESLEIPTDHHGNVLESTLSTKIHIMLGKQVSEYRALIWHKIHW